MTPTTHPCLVNFPQPLDADAYGCASAELEGRLAELPGLVALYRLGSVAHHGISDLDRIAVVDQDVEVHPIWDELSHATRDVALHSPFLVDVTTFRLHRWFAYLSPLELVGGVEVTVENPPDSRVSDLYVAAEGLVTLALKLLKQSRTGRVKVRSFLCELHTLRFSLSLAGMDGASAPRSWEFARKVMTTRQGWFEMSTADRESAFTDLLDEAPHALLDGLLALDRIAREHTHADRPAHIDLPAPWNSVTLVACGEGALPMTLIEALAPRRSSSLSGRSRRAAELRWRTFDDQLPLPDGVLALVGATARRATAFLAERHRIVNAYDRFFSPYRAGYSRIGMAGTFS